MKRFLTIVLIAGVLTAAVYLILRRKPETSGVPLPELLTLVPKDLVAVGYVDFAAMRSSAFWRKTTALFPPEEQDPEYAQFVQQTGFDYSRDLDRAAIAWLVATAPHVVELAIAEGRFDREKIRAYAAKNGERQETDGLETFRFRRKGSDDVIFSFLSDSRVILAKTDGTGEIFVRDFAKSPPTQEPFEPEMTRHLAEVAGAACFVVGRVVKSDKKSPGARNWLAEQLGDLQGSVDWMTLAARPEQDRLRILMEAESSGTWKAMQLGLLLDGMKLLAKSALQQPENTKDFSRKELDELRAFLEKTTTTRDGNRVQARMELTPTLIQVFVAKEKRNQRKEKSVSR